MEQPRETDSPDPEPSPISQIVVLAVFWTVLAACTVVPWVLQATVGWWAALLSIPMLFSVYDYLFVPKGSLCMGLPFGIPLSSAMCLFLVNVAIFMKWVYHLIAGP
jgi:hypothetical protein